MKKTLFLSAILGAALCSSAFGAATILTINDGAAHTLGSTTGGAQNIEDGSSITVIDGTLEIKNRLNFAGTSTLASTGTQTTFSGTNVYNIVVNGGANLTLKKAAGAESATFDVSGCDNGLAIGSNATLTLDEDVTLKSKRAFFTSAVTGNGTLVMKNNSSAQFTNDVTLSALVADGTASFSAGATNNIGAVTVNQGGSLTFSATTTNAGAITVNQGGSLTFSATTTNAGAITVNQGGSLAIGNGTVATTMNANQFTGSGNLTISANATINSTRSLSLADLTSAEESGIPNGNGFVSLAFSGLDIGIASSLNVTNNGNIKVDGYAVTLDNQNKASFSSDAYKYYIKAGGFNIGDAKWVVSDIGNGNNASLAANKNLTYLQVLSGTMSTGGALTTKYISMDAAENSSLTIANGTGNLTVTDSGSIRSLSASRLIFGDNAGRVSLSGTNTLGGMLDLSTSYGAFAGELLLKSGASLTQNETFWMRSTSAGILLEKDATYTHGWLTIKGLSSTEGQLGQLVKTSGSSTYDLATSDIDLRNVEATISATTNADTTLANKLVNSSLKYTNSAATGKTLTLTAAGSSLTGINMGNGATLKIAANVNLNGTATLNQLTLSGGNIQINGGTTTAADVEIQADKLLDNRGGVVTISGTVTNNGNLYQQTSKAMTLGKLVNTGTVIINHGTQMTVSQLDATAGTIKGAGQLNVHASTTPNNTTIDFDNFASGLNNTTVSFKQAHGTLKAATGDITNKIVLTNDSWAGAEWVKVEGTSYTFTNAITGDGNFVFNGSNGEKSVALTFKGDLSGWNSSASNSTLRGLRAAGAMNLDVTLSGSLTNNVANDFNTDDGSTMALTVDRNTTLAGRLHVTALSVNANKTVKASNSHVQVANSIALGDGANLTISAAGAQTTGALTLGSGSTLTLGSAAEGEHDFDLTTSGLKVNGNSNINANLVMNSGTLTFADNAVLTMGCDVTIGNDVTVMLTDTMVESIQAGNWVQIIAGVDNANLGQSLTFAGSGTMSDYVNEHAGVYQLTQIGDKVYITPEPATATLSLLALAALAARRKRH